MTDYLLDTNILKYWYNPHCPEHQNVLVHLQTAQQPDSQSGYVSHLFISVVTLGEIEYGHCVENNPDKIKQREYLIFIRNQCPKPMELTHHVAEQYGELKAWLFNNYSPKSRRTKAKRVEELTDPISARELGVQENDLWIAAQAMTHNLTLITHDSCGNFGELLLAFNHSLRVEDWTL